MECKVSELVKRGHDQAAELKSSCGGAVAQLISDLSTQLDVQLARSNALAAENAGLKECNTDIMKHVYRSKTYLDSSRVVDAIQGLQCAIERKSGKTTATDAFLAEVRASAITDALKSLDVVFDTDCVMETNGITYEEAEQRTTGALAVNRALIEFAAQLRKGVQS